MLHRHVLTIAVAANLLSFGARPAVAQRASRLDRDRGHAMLETIRHDLEERYYDSTYHGTDLTARFAAADARVDSAGSLSEILIDLAQLGFSFGDSHTFFLPPEQTVSVDYGWAMQVVGDSCYVARVRKGSDAAAQGLKRGDLVLSVNGHLPTRANLWQLEYVYQLLRPQPGLRVVVRSPGGAPRQLDLAARVRQHPRVLDLTGQDGGTDIWALLAAEEEDEERWAPRYYEIGDDVLLWSLPTFSVDPDVIADGVKKARGRRALVLDLRGNGGGAVRSMLELLGRLSDQDVRVGTVRTRRDTTVLVAKGQGDDAFTGKVVVLVDGQSASASEIVARSIQLQKRGIVVGDRTEGAVQRSRILDHRMGGATVFAYGMSVADGQIVMADGSSLEGRGVVPDESVLPTPGDLAAGRDPALARALELAGHPVTAAEAGAILEQR